MAKAISTKKLEKANISCKHFEELIGVSRGTVGRYLIGKVRKEELITRVEVGAQVMSELGLVWPNIHYIPSSEKLIKEYQKNKKQSEKLDKKFKTAFVKAMKKAGL